LLVRDYEDDIRSAITHDCCSLVFFAKSKLRPVNRNALFSLFEGERICQGIQSQNTT